MSQHARPRDATGREGPPQFFLRRRTHALLEMLTEVFEPHRDELTVDPATRPRCCCARWCSAPATPASRPTTGSPPTQIADVLLDGIRPPTEGATDVLLRTPARAPAPLPPPARPSSSLLQFVGTMAALYLPSLNADIIDNGVARGDTGYIVRTGGVMLAVSLVQIVCSVGAVYVGARDRDGLRPRPARGAVPPGRHASPAARSRRSARRR